MIFESLKPTRRQLLAGTCLSLTSGSARAEDPVNDAGSLARLAARSNRYFGSAVRLEHIVYENDLRDAVLRECACLTPELSLKWAAIEPSRGKLSLSSMDDLASFAISHGMKVRGHTMLWHKSIPAWADDYLLDTKDWKLIQKHFGSIIPRYGEAIDEWDVVNEPIETGFRADGLRENTFLKAFGPSYIRRALEEARIFAPKARLMINEFSLEYDTRLESDRRYCFLRLIEDLKKTGTPLDGIGLQSHLDLGKGPFSEKVFENFLQELAGFGLDVVITELDVKEYQYILPADARDLEVAKETKRYLDVALAQPSVKGVVTWGLTDRHSWLEVTNEDFARYPDAWKNGEGPGLNRGLPFDSSMRPKTMHKAIAAAFLKQPLG